MKIRRLFLRSVRNIKSLDLDFRDPVTGKPMSRVVLVRANGSGKTRILANIFGLLEAVEKYGPHSLDFVHLDTSRDSRDYFLSKLAVLASRQMPEDIHLLVEDRILPRWRRARAASRP